MLKAFKNIPKLSQTTQPSLLPRCYSNPLISQSKFTFSSSQTKSSSQSRILANLFSASALVFFSLVNNKDKINAEDQTNKPKERFPSSSQRSGPKRFSANVLIIGDSQSGKSTFIKKLYELAGKEAPETLKIGSGGEATTSNTHVYNIPLKLSEIGLFDQYKRELDWSKAFGSYESFDELSDERNLELRKGNVIAEVDLNLIDTPGLKGTDKNDEDNMFELIQTLTDIGSVNCVLLLNKGTNYGPNFEETLMYYHDMLGRTIPVHMLHTKYTSDDILRDIQANVNTYKNSARIREFKKLFPNISGEHWLIDSIPKHNRPFREFLTQHTINTWLASIASEREISTKNLTFTKTAKMKRIDRMVQARNQALSEGHGEGLSDKNVKLRKILQKITSLSRTVDEQKNEIDSLQKELDEKNSKVPEFMKTKNVSHTWTLWPTRQEHEIEIHTGDPIMEVEKVIFNEPASYWVPSSESKYGEEAMSKEYRIRIESKIWRGCYASISLYTYKKYKFAEQIPFIKDKLNTMNLGYWKNQKELNEYKVDHNEFKKTISELENEIRIYNDTNPKIVEEKIPFGLYREVEKLYKSDSWDSSSGNELHELARELTKAYQRYYFTGKPQEDNA